MQTERTAKGTLVIWPEEGKKGLLSVIESEESPWLFFSSLPPLPSADPVIVVVNVGQNPTAFFSCLSFHCLAHPQTHSEEVHRGSEKLNPQLSDQKATRKLNVSDLRKRELKREELLGLFLSSVNFEDWTVDYRITQTPKWPLGSTQSRSK